jgi:very-short-patch-repair endonuclease
MPFKDRMKPAKVRFPRQMHQKPTASEAALWNRLKSRQLGVPFLSQECILGYIVDFYCPPAKLVVEVDGAIHQTAEQRAHDKKKDRALRRYGLVVLRLASGLSTEDAVGRIDRKLHFLQVKRDAGPSAPERENKKLAA